MTRGSNSAAAVSAEALQRWLQVLAWEHARAAHGSCGPSPHEPGLDGGERLAAALAMLAAIADLEDALAAAKASAVERAGVAGAFHGDVAAALGVTRQAVSDRWWRHLASHPGRPAAGMGRARRVDVAEQQRRRVGHLAAAADLAAALDGGGRDLRRAGTLGGPARERPLPPVEDGLF
jgi:hypothetical protein